MDRKSTIYIVDDEPDILDVISGLVKPIEANVETFGRAEDFLSKFQYEGPACLVLDVRLPDMSGLELQKMLAQSACQIPIIFITGYADIKMALNAIQMGAVNFFEKPFRMQELFDQIQKVIRADIESWQRRNEKQHLFRKLEPLKSGEREVINLIAEGKTNEQIAKELHLSVRGVETRRAKAMKTLRVDSKAELMHLLRTFTAPKASKYPS